MESLRGFGFNIWSCRRCCENVVHLSWSPTGDVLFGLIGGSWSTLTGDYLDCGLNLMHVGPYMDRYTWLLFSTPRRRSDDLIEKSQSRDHMLGFLSVKTLYWSLYNHSIKFTGFSLGGYCEALFCQVIQLHFRTPRKRHTLVLPSSTSLCVIRAGLVFDQRPRAEKDRKDAGGVKNNTWRCSKWLWVEVTCAIAFEESPHPPAWGSDEDQSVLSPWQLISCSLWREENNRVCG